MFQKLIYILFVNFILHLSWYLIIRIGGERQNYVLNRPIELILLYTCFSSERHDSNSSTKEISSEAASTLTAEADSNLSTYTECSESMASNKNLTDTNTNAASRTVRSETQSSIDEVYHDIETEYSSDTLEKLIERAEMNKTSASTATNTPTVLTTTVESSSSAPLAQAPPSIGLTTITASSRRKSISDQELVESFSLQMHRIDKDVARCDRNYYYFVSNDNLKKLRNIMYT